MIITTTPSVQGKQIKEFQGVISAQSAIGANVIKDFGAGIRDFFGGRSGSYERVLSQAKEDAMRELEQKAQEKGADAIIGVTLDYESLGRSMLMVAAAGTAVRLEDA